MRAMNPSEKPNGPVVLSDARGLQRLHFELALEMSAVDERPPRETLAHAAQSAGADLLFVLPAPRGDGLTAVIRLVDEGVDHFLQVGSAESGFAVSDEAAMDQTLLGLARASVDVLQRMSADRSIREPLAAASTI
jgi:hypothetical protein